MTEFLRQLFVANKIIILSIYGQVFFVLGLVIALQSWRHSRLVLARRLPWLAAFGFAYGLHEWSDVFIPLQAEYMPRQVVDVLWILQTILLAVSFAFLFQFGVETLRPLPSQSRWLRYLPATCFTLWMVWAYATDIFTAHGEPEVHLMHSAWARYGLGFPGALLAAYGLRRQSNELIAPLQMPHISRTLRIAGLALAGYGIMGGLVPPPGDFFPANWLNSAQVEHLTLIPVQVYRSFLGFTLTLAIIRTLEVFRVELDRRLSGMEETQVIMVERERIGRELHDGTLQTIYAAGLLLQTAEKELAQNGPNPVAGRLQQSMQLLNQAVAEIRGYIATLRAQPDSHSLAAGLQDLTADRNLRTIVDVDLTLDLPKGRPMAPARIGHLLAITNEALSNVARHSQATHAHVAAAVAGNWLRLEIRDNGRGLPADYVSGYGLRNIRDRARLLGGEMWLDSQPGHGTRVWVEVPWSEEDEAQETSGS